MSYKMIPSLEILPVEILYHIIDDLDTKTILFSLRNTCRRFRAVVNSYDRYVLNFESISKPNFDLICRLIDPNRVTSLTLSENGETFDQIKLFLVYFHFRQFNRLRSLSLLISEEERLRAIVERVDMHSLQSFSLKIQRSDDRRKTTTARLLSSLIAKSNLSRLELHIQDGRFEKLIWPTQCFIQYLSVENCIAIDQTRSILQCFPHLRTLVMNSFSILNPNQLLCSSFKHLTSLTLSKVSTKIDNLELFLSMTPALVHLKLIGTGDYCDGHRWEHFIQLHLPLLHKFEFVFNQTVATQQNPLDLNDIVVSFQTPFWLEQRKWFVICETDSDLPRCITLYSIPMCLTFLTYETNKTSISTCPESKDKNLSIMDNVNTVRLNFKTLSSFHTKIKDIKINQPLFRKVKKLELQFGIFRSIGWIESVSKLIDLNTVFHVKISSTLIRQCNPYMLLDTTEFLRKISHLSSIDICFDFLSRKSSLTAADICSMIPSDIKHLAVSIKDVKEIKCILGELQHLSSANFLFDYIPTWKEVIEWIDDNRKGSSYQADSFSVCVWLGESNSNNSKEIETSNKRMKLVDEHYQS